MRRDNIHTVLPLSYRLVGLDLDDPVIADGERITLELLSRIKTKRMYFHRLPTDHFNARGYNVLASVVGETVKRLEW